nr:immunoglobulin heavy chain junction region [Macaca mulatta]MOY19355.1 immunoglobulin heavy chain junction region [Macaca mulatta]MOY19613.1 immunoglobulin heavy chain junction region [Macaca mulatta]MOY19652.1 immunoglobulin heavy chain junction region [Macaca mulatta]MOY20371.1 immunoglobulin heavy chain junction region [Macaca mulatta]
CAAIQRVKPPQPLLPFEFW